MLPGPSQAAPSETCGKHMRPHLLSLPFFFAFFQKFLTESVCSPEKASPWEGVSLGDHLAREQ